MPCPLQIRLYYLGCVLLGYSGIGIYSGIYSGYSATGSRIAGMEIQVFRNENSSQTNAYSHYSNYSYSGLIPNERALKLEASGRLTLFNCGFFTLLLSGVFKLKALPPPPPPTFLAD